MIRLNDLLINYADANHELFGKYPIQISINSESAMMTIKQMHFLYKGNVCCDVDLFVTNHNSKFAIICSFEEFVDRLKHIDFSSIRYSIYRHGYGYSIYHRDYVKFISILKKEFHQCRNLFRYNGRMSKFEDNGRTLIIFD